MKRYALIVAGGSGSRMKADLPKQFLLLDDLPVLMHTIASFSTCDERIIVLPEAHIATWKALCATHNFSIPHQVVAGGDQRFDSVKNGLSHVPDDALVAVHDGVRPFATAELIAQSFVMAEQHGGVIPVVAPKNSLRQLTDTGSVHVPREQYREVQTPQTFRSSELKNAYKAKYSSVFTDDASVYEAAGYTIALMDGDYRNLKITTPEDLVIGAMLMQK